MPGVKGGGRSTSLHPDVERHGTAAIPRFSLTLPTFHVGGSASRTPDQDPARFCGGHRGSVSRWERGSGQRRMWPTWSTPETWWKETRDKPWALFSANRWEVGREHAGSSLGSAGPEHGPGTQPCTEPRSPLERVRVPGVELPRSCTTGRPGCKNRKLRPILDPQCQKMSAHRDGPVRGGAGATGATGKVRARADAQLKVNPRALF